MPSAQSNGADSSSAQILRLLIKSFVRLTNLHQGTDGADQPEEEEIELMAGAVQRRNISISRVMTKGPLLDLNLLFSFHSVHPVLFEFFESAGDKWPLFPSAIFIPSPAN